MNANQPYLQVSNIQGYYGESYIVQDVSFSLEEKQALLEAPHLTDRRETLTALMEFTCRGGGAEEVIQ